jgi:DNA-binding NtrC family response regulator
MITHAAHVLLIEDDDSLREVMAFNLEDAGFAVDVASKGRVGADLYNPHVHDVVITDIRMPDVSGVEVLRGLKARDPQAVVVVMTAFGGSERAIEAMRLGAFHYVEKPVNMTTLLAILDKAVALRRATTGSSRGLTRSAPQKHELVASSHRMSELLRTIDKVANTDATVLITGESGTGKELVARALHERSQRAEGPFVALSCAAIPADLLESTLFGHARGAFTGAVNASKGKFLAANGGTLFLDEVAELPLALQAKLLRALQEGEVEPVGGGTVAVDVRILAATHRDLAEEVAAGRFRDDLLWRLNVVPIKLPALRERPEDIPALLRFFIQKHARGAQVTVTRAVDERMIAYRWPGNVRELENVVRRMIALRDGDELGLPDLPAWQQRVDEPHLSAPPTQGLPFELPPDGLDLRDLERRVIIAALEKHDGNQSATARYLHIPRHVLMYRIEKYGIQTR